MTNYMNALGATLRTSGASATFTAGTTATETWIGTDRNDTLLSNGGGDTMIGGLGDDIYVVYVGADRVVELAGAGVDTTIAYTTHILSADVENLTIEGNNAWYGGGNALDNILVSRSVNQQLDGGAGNDVLVGSTRTSFIINAGNGSDMIYNWNSTASIRLQGYGLTSFDQVRSIASQVGADTVLDFANGEKLVIASASVADLQASQFKLGLDTSRMTISFADEFDTLSLHRSGGTWWTEYGYGDGPGTVTSRVMNNESQIYMEGGFDGDSPTPLGIDPFSITDGVLAITATPTPIEAMPYLDNRSYTSGLLSSKQTYSQQYGYFEIRAQLPAGQGFWPAFWLLPADNSWPPEIDVFEQLGKDPTTLYSTTHYIVDGDRQTTQTRTHIDTTEWHTYGVNWTPDYLIHTVDGIEVARQPTPAGFDKEMFLIANLAVGGWSGGPDATTGTGQMKIDYIHAFRTEDTVATTVNGIRTFYRPDGLGGSEALPNEAPVASAGSAVGTEDTYLWVSPTDGLLRGATDAEGHPLTATLVTQASHGVIGLAADGSFDYYVDRDYHGSDSFTFLVTDALGSVSATQTFTIEMAAANDAPVAQADAGFVAAYGASLKIGGAALVLNDVDIDGDLLSVVAVGDAEHGSVVLRDGNAIFTADVGYSGAASFTYTASDAQGLTSIATVALTIDVPIIVPAGTNPYIYGEAGADLFDKAGTTVAWMINGAGGRDVLTGGTANDSLNGGIGEDVIDGGAGNDILTGGAGADTLTGGAGNDTFIVRPADLMRAGGALDRIVDFTGAGMVGGDVLHFAGFTAAATLTLVGQVGDQFQYHVEDGTIAGDFLINTDLLSGDDYHFYFY